MINLPTYIPWLQTTKVSVCFGVTHWHIAVLINILKGFLEGNNCQRNDSVGYYGIEFIEFSES